jgi:hypothetical protein
MILLKNIIGWKNPPAGRQQAKGLFTQPLTCIALKVAC